MIDQARKQYAYTGPTPASGYVGFFNITELDTDTVRVTVRSEGDNPVTASFDMPSSKLFTICWHFIWGDHDLP